MTEPASPHNGPGKNILAEFNASDVPPRESAMNAEMIRSLAENSPPFSEDQLQQMLTKHKQFIEGGGGGGRFEKLHVSGLPMNIYMGRSPEGKHFEVRMKQFTAKSTLQNAELSMADFSGSICEEVDFSGANLTGALLTDAFFAGANFEGAALEGVDFTGCDLRNVSFKGANLRNADFEIANCEGADFTDADIMGAVFPGCNLTGIKR